MAKYKVFVDREIRDLVPGYLENRRREVAELFSFHSAGNFKAIRKAGHRLAGSGGGYGFDRLSELGQQLEELSQAGDAAGVAARLADLKEYLENLEVVYR
ncbi:MAG TPA: Hpt domain-containing protein [Elusimicrobiales bacterium]|nr:Hpt domain-containing protein [Elusimicrobiales bacterium]